MSSPFATPGITFGVDTSQNYLTWGNAEAVTLVSPHKTTGNTSFAIPKAKRRNPTFKEQAPSGGVYGSALMVFLLPAALVAAAGAIGNDAPRQAFQIVDAVGVTWTVQDAALNTLKSTWKCTALNLVIVYNLQDTLTVKRPAIDTDAAGGRVYKPGDYTTVYSDIPCRFQEVTAAQTDERGKRLAARKFSVPVAQRLYLTVEDQIVDEAGNVYEVTGWHDADRIDQLQTIECEQRW
jgi:hypothetical protein